MKFQYSSTIQTNTKGRLVKKPMIELELVGKGKNVKALGLIDSGADTTLMNIEYARALGIELDPDSRKDFVGISAQKIPCYMSSVTLKVKHFEATITTPVGFIDSPSVDILLGQEDFFECFRIKFEKDHDIFEVTLTPKAKN